MLNSILYGSEEIEFELEFVDRKSLGITVHANRSIAVKAPLGSSIEKIEERIRKKHRGS